MIRFDRTPDTVLAHCSCGWRELSRSAQGAATAATDHVWIAHPDPSDLTHKKFLAASRKRRQRLSD